RRGSRQGSFRDADFHREFQARRHAAGRGREGRGGGRSLMPTLGLIAGSGRFPILVAEQAKRMGVDVVALGIKGVTDAELDRIARVEYFRLGQIDKPLQFLKKAGVRQAVMAGKVQHHSLFGGILPDLRAVKLLAGLKDRRTDTILAAVADEFKREGIELLPSSTYLSHLLAVEG